MRLPAWLGRFGATREIDAARSIEQKRTPADGVSEPDPVVARAAELSAKGDYAESLRILASALEQGRTEAELWLALGATLFDCGRTVEAGSAFAKAEALGCDRLALYLNGAQTYFVLGRLDEARGAVERALEIDPQSAAAHFGRATIHRMLGEHQLAVSVYETALQFDPDRTDCLAAIAACHVDRGDGAAAERAARAAIAARPQDAAVWITLGMAMMLQESADAAYTAFQHAADLETATSMQPQAFVNHGFALLHFGRVDDAIALFRTHLPRNPSVSGHTTYGFALLTSGRFREGWQQYEFRWMQDPMASFYPRYTQPEWRGQRLEGKTLLVRAEQGAGDLIQFARFGTAFKRLGARVVLQVAGPLKAFAWGFAGFDLAVTRDEPPGPFDYYVHSMSIPRVLDVTIGTIPADVPYYAVDIERKAEWAQRVGKAPGLHVGIVWAGDPRHLKDRQRSMSLRDLEPLFDLPNVTWYSLQKVVPAADADVMAKNSGIVDLASSLRDFRDTAAIVENLDLVLSVDTAVAHLTGALGKPVWVMLPAHAEFRWLRSGTRTPWYPTMRLFRQPRPGEWGGAVKDVAGALVQLASGSAGRDDDAGMSVADYPSDVLDDAPAGVTAVLDTRYGVLQVVRDGDLIVEVLARSGSWLDDVVSAMITLLPSDAVVLEIGSGIGAHAVAIVRKLAPSAHLLLAEGDALRRQIATQNVAASKLNGQITVLRDVPAIYAHHSDANRQADGPRDNAKSFVDDLWLDRLDLLKIHCTHAPRLALESAEATLWRLRPTVAVTFEPHADVAPVLDVLHAHGYRVWRLDSSIAEGGATTPDDLGDDCTFCTLVALPEERGVAFAMSGSTELRNDEALAKRADA